MWACLVLSGWFSTVRDRKSSRQADSAVIVEIVAGIAAAAIIEGVVPGSIALSKCATADVQSWLIQRSGLSAGTTQAQGVMIEL